VALDLAIQAAGLVSVPVSDPAAAAGRAWVDEKDINDSKDGKDDKDLPDRPAGGVVAGLEELSQEELIAAADRIQEAVGQGRGREIVVLGRSPERWPDRALLSWATVQGAAVLLAPDPASLIASAVWARPTLFYGNTAELAAFRRAVEEEQPPFWARKQGRLPFGRLWTVLCEREISLEDRRFWEGRGVRALVV
jgi:hypothetical protein